MYNIKFTWDFIVFSSWSTSIWRTKGKKFCLKSILKYSSSKLRILCSKMIYKICMIQQATLVTTNTYISFQFNLSHAIRHLSFGQDYPGIINPLDQTSQISEDGRSFWCSNTCTHLLMFAMILAPCAPNWQSLKLLLFENFACVLTDKF